LLLNSSLIKLPPEIGLLLVVGVVDASALVLDVAHEVGPLLLAGEAAALKGLVLVKGDHRT
jgi:hypothetical protein